MNKVIKNNLFMFKLIFKYCPNHIFCITFMSLFNTGATLTNLLLMKYVIDSLTSLDAFRNVLSMILLLSIIGISAAILNAYFNNYIKPLNIAKIEKEVKNYIYEHSLSIDYILYDNIDFYNKFNYAIQKTSSVALDAVNSIAEIFSAILSIGTITTIVVYLKPEVMLFSLVSVIITLILQYKSYKIQHKHSVEINPKERELQYIGRIYYLKEYAQELRINSSLCDLISLFHNNANNEKLKIIDKFGAKQAKISTVSGVGSAVLNSISYVYLSYCIYQNLITLGSFASLTASISQLSNSINSLFSISLKFYNNNLYAETIKDFFSLQSIEKIKSEKIKYKDDLNIYLENISFKYSSLGDYCLKNINLNIKFGDKIALIGANGAGKSTIAKLLIGLYKPFSGNIYINDKKIELFDSSLQDNINYLLQDYRLFSMTIAENVLLRYPTNEEEEKNITNALKAACVYEKVSALPNGIYTVLTNEFDEHGLTLSGGELQKIALARTFAKKSKVIILDEPFSAIDQQSQKKILNYLKNLKNTTIILVTHYVEGIESFGTIYTFANGQISKRLEDH